MRFRARGGDVFPRRRVGCLPADRSAASTAYAGAVLQRAGVAKPGWLIAEASGVQRFLQWVMDPRYILVRALALVYVVGGFFPASFQSFEPLYLLFHIASRALLLASTFFPVSAGLAGAAFYLLFLWAYPDYLNTFDAPMQFAAAVLLASGRWVVSLLLTALAFVTIGIGLEVQPELGMPYSALVYNWVYYSLLGLVGAFLSSRISRETELREQAGREHEQQLQRTRLSYAIDTHDTVSHSLAAQAGIIRLLALEQDPLAAKRLLGELALANGEAQAQLRALITRLSATGEPEEEAVRSVPGLELRRTVERLCETAEIAGFSVEFSAGELPEAIPAETFGELTLLARELVTNMVKHASDRAGRLDIAVDADGQGGIVRMASRNREGTGRAAEPRSLSSRAAALGGSCEVERHGDELAVTVAIPILRANIPRTRDAQTLRVDAR